jgi:hypothetical protein
MNRYFEYTMYPGRPFYYVLMPGHPRGLIWDDGEWSETTTTRFIEMLSEGDVYLDEIPESALPANVNPV